MTHREVLPTGKTLCSEDKRALADTPCWNLSGGRANAECQQDPGSWIISKVILVCIFVDTFICNLYINSAGSEVALVLETHNV